MHDEAPIMAPDDYVLWLKGLFDAIGDRLPTEQEWATVKDQHVMQVGYVVLRRIEEREIAQRIKLQQAKEEEEKRKIYEVYEKQQAMYYQQLNTVRAAAAGYQKIPPGRVVMVDDRTQTVAATPPPSLLDRALKKLHK